MGQNRPTFRVLYAISTPAWEKYTSAGNITYDWVRQSLENGDSNHSSRELSNQNLWWMGRTGRTTTICVNKPVQMEQGQGDWNMLGQKSKTTSSLFFSTTSTSSSQSEQLQVILTTFCFLNRPNASWTISVLLWINVFTTISDGEVSVLWVRLRLSRWICGSRQLNLMENNLFLYTLLKGVGMKYNDLTGHDHSNGGTVISQS